MEKSSGGFEYILLMVFHLNYCMIKEENLRMLFSNTLQNLLGIQNMRTTPYHQQYIEHNTHSSRKKHAQITTQSKKPAPKTQNPNK